VLHIRQEKKDAGKCLLKQRLVEKSKKTRKILEKALARTLNP
jgi:hypothetical protein